MRRQSEQGRNRGRAPRFLAGALAAVAATAAAFWACESDDGTPPTPPPCGALDPETGEVPVCGDGLSCVCATGECAVRDGGCAAGWRVATLVDRCLSPAQVASLVPSTAAEHPACGGADADADADAEADGWEATDEATVEDAPFETPDGPRTIELVVFAGEELFPDRQEARRTVGFPVIQPYERILLQYDIRTGCPTLCDPEARLTTVRLELGGGGSIELLRAVAPAGSNARFVEDVTALAPLLAYAKPLVVFLDTRAGGWEFDLQFLFTTGDPPRRVREAIALYDETAFAATTNLPERLVTIPAGTTAAELVYRFTGHSTTGEGCDETCARSALVHVDGLQRLEVQPWRDDCADFVAANPRGDPAVIARSRSGWCPGDIVATGTSSAGTWLGPGDHVIDLSVVDVDPTTGTWRLSLVLVLYR